MTQSIAEAVQIDGPLVVSVLQEEETASGDHALAHRINGSNVVFEVHLQTGTMDDNILSKLAGQYDPYCPTTIFSLQAVAL
jgi:hypothetical protein